MKDDFSMKITDLVQDAKFKEYLQDEIDDYVLSHYGAGKRVSKFKRTPLDGLQDKGLLTVAGVSLIGMKVQVGARVELDVSSSQRKAAFDLFTAAAQQTLRLRHREFLKAKIETQKEAK